MRDPIKSILARLSELESNLSAVMDPARAFRTSTDAFSSSLNNLLQTAKLTLGGQSRVWDGFDQDPVSVFEVQQGHFGFFPYTAALVISIGAVVPGNRHNINLMGDADSFRLECWNYNPAAVCQPVKFRFFNGGTAFEWAEAKQVVAGSQPRVAIGGSTGPVSGTGTVWIRGGDTIRICEAERTAAGVGNLGDMCFDTDNLYIYTSVGWKRAVLI